MPNDAALPSIAGQILAERLAAIHDRLQVSLAVIEAERQTLTPAQRADAVTAISARWERERAEAYAEAAQNGEQHHI